MSLLDPNVALFAPLLAPRVLDGEVRHPSVHTGCHHQNRVVYSLGRAVPDNPGLVPLKRSTMLISQSLRRNQVLKEKEWRGCGCGRVGIGVGGERVSTWKQVASTPMPIGPCWARPSATGLPVPATAHLSVSMLSRSCAETGHWPRALKYATRADQSVQSNSPRLWRSTENAFATAQSGLTIVRDPAPRVKHDWGSRSRRDLAGFGLSHIGVGLLQCRHSFCRIHQPLE